MRLLTANSTQKQTTESHITAIRVCVCVFVSVTPWDLRVLLYSFA